MKTPRVGIRPMAREPAKGPLWQSHRFWMQVLATFVFLTLTLSRVVALTADHLLTFVLALAGLGVGARTVTGVTAIVAGAMERRFERQDALARDSPPFRYPCQATTMVERPSSMETDEDGMPRFHVDAPMPPCKPFRPPTDSDLVDADKPRIPPGPVPHSR